MAGFPGGVVVKNPPAMQDTSGRSPGGGNGNSLQYSCRRNPRDRGAGWVTVHEITIESDTTE